MHEEDIHGGRDKAAARWFARRREGALNNGERAAFERWLAAHPANRVAYEDVARLWTDAAIAARRVRARPAQGRRIVPLALAASLALALGVGGWAAIPNHPFADYRTEAGALRALTLPDGSRVDLSTETALSLDFTPEARTVVLHGGEAFFAVAPDAERPFTVAAGPMRATALGTEFSVARHGGNGSVAVRQHAVAVEFGDDRAEVRAGQRIEFAAAGLARIRVAELESEFAWRDGRLVFLSRPLGEVVAELDRWRPGRMFVTDAALAARPVTVILDMRRSGDPLAALRDALGIDFTSLTPYLTLVRPGS